MVTEDIIERIKAAGIDADRLKAALDSKDNWGALVYSFEYLTVLGVVCDAMQAAARREEIDSLVGYERRLEKMRFQELLAEAERVKAQVFPNITRPILLARILEAQGISDAVFNPPKLDE